MIQQNYPNNQPPQGYGWFGGENQQQGSNNVNNRNSGQTPFPQAPSTPSLFLPNFVPPVYYQNSFPYPNYNFPNFNVYPFAPPFNPNLSNGNGQAGGQPGGNQNINNNGQNTGEQIGGNPDVNAINRGPNPMLFTTTTQASSNLNEVESHNRLDEKENKFLTNAFFGDNNEGSQKVNREWTETDEMKWQSTTKAPYFENKVPGLDHCTLPASAVLGE